MAKKRKIILGLDLSLNSTGYCILYDDKICPDGYGIISFKSGGFEGKKLHSLEKRIRKIINTHKPDFLCIENIFKGRNINTFKTLSMVRGVVYKIAYEKGLEDKTFCISAVQARKIIGCGKKKTEAFAYISKRYKKFEFNFDKHNDIVDAVGLALACYMLNRKNKKK